MMERPEARRNAALPRGSESGHSIRDEADTRFHRDADLPPGDSTAVIVRCPSRRAPARIDGSVDPSTCSSLAKLPPPAWGTTLPPSLSSFALKTSWSQFSCEIHDTPRESLVGTPRMSRVRVCGVVSVGIGQNHTRGPRGYPRGYPTPTFALRHPPTGTHEVRERTTAAEGGRRLYERFERVKARLVAEGQTPDPLARPVRDVETELLVRLHPSGALLALPPPPAAPTAAVVEQRRRSRSCPRRRRRLLEDSAQGVKLSDREASRPKVDWKWSVRGRWGGKGRWGGEMEPVAWLEAMAA